MISTAIQVAIGLILVFFFGLVRFVMVGSILFLIPILVYFPSFSFCSEQKDALATP